MARLKSEAARSLQLTHPHIVRLINFELDGTRGDLAYLVMQYINGQTLDDLLHECDGGLPTERVVTWAKQIGDAIDYAHEYARGNVTTNTVEGFFALIKRGMYGTFHSVSKKHLHRYLAEFEFRYNTREMDDGERTLSAIRKSEGKRLRYHA